MITPNPACPHCGKPVKLDEAYVRVPYRRTRWWQFTDERGEFRCRACQGFSVLALSRTGMALYGVELLAIALGWSAGVPVTGLLAGGAVLAALLFRHAVRLARV